MASEWNNAILGSVCTKIGSGATPRGGKETYRGGDTALIRSQNIYNDRFTREGLAYIDDFQANELRNVIVEDDDVLLNITGDSVARCCLVDSEILPARVNQHVAIIRPQQAILDARFLRYSLICPKMQAHLLALASAGATRNALTKSMIESLVIRVPSLNEQRAIAHILGTLDDKIELNRRMSETLEAMARALFKAWFVDFEPVRAKLEGRWRRGQSLPGLPARLYDLFPDRLVDSELGDIPEGWSIENIKSLTSNIQYGLTQSASKIKCGPRFLRITDIQGGRINWDSVPFCQVTNQELEKYKIRQGDIFVARTGASTGENIYIVSAPESVFASYLVRFQFNDPATGRYVGLFMRTDSYFEYVANNLGGSAQPNANAQTLAMAKLVFPNHEIVQLFSRIIDGIDIKRSKNEEQISALIAIRDTLLPKLISGDLRIDLIEKIIKED